MNDHQKKLEDAKLHALQCIMAATDGGDACAWAQTYSTLMHANPWIPQMTGPVPVAMEDVR